ncbi:MAG: hypothetical protein IJH71_04750 [Eubacterium sp.]|nr:hypothetical protein [Eubacterium sp.]
MNEERFYRNNHMTASLENDVPFCQSFEDFERRWSEELLNEDTRIGDYLGRLLSKYDKAAAAVSKDAGLAFAYVGNIINGKKNNPSRNVLISICFAIGTTFEEAQYLLKYAGHAPLYVRRKRDVIIWFGFMKHQDLHTVNGLLVERGLQPLIREK